MDTEITQRLEYLRGELRGERMSWGELAELQSLASHIDAGDVELREAAGLPEFGDTIADHAPSMDQIDTSAHILARVEHPLTTGAVVMGHRATYCDRTHVYSLAVEIVEAPEEIYASPALRCYRIAPDGTYTVATSRDVCTLALLDRVEG